MKNPRRSQVYFTRRKQAWKSWHSITDGKKHKMAACMRKFKGEVEDEGAFCGWLREQAKEEENAMQQKRKSYPDPFKFIKNPELLKKPVENAKKKEFKKGDIVRFTRKFLKSIGSVTGPINGIVLGKSGTWVSVQWSDADEPVLVHPVNLELDPRHKKKNPTYRASCAPKAGKLTAAKERRLPDKAYGLPKERKYPMPDASHARNAKARASAEYKRGNLTRKQYAQIQRKANRIIKGCGGDPAPVKNPEKKMKKNPEHETRELELFIDNDAELYRQRTVPIQQNLVKKKLAGTFDLNKAPKLFGYLVEAGAKKYAKEFGGTWNKIFSVADRRKLSMAMAFRFDSDYGSGEYDDMIEEVAPAAYKRAKMTGKQMRVLAGTVGLPKKVPKYKPGKLSSKLRGKNPKKKTRRKVKRKTKRKKPKVSVTVSRSVTVTQNPSHNRIISAWLRGV